MKSIDLHDEEAQLIVDVLAHWVTMLNVDETVTRQAHLFAGRNVKRRCQALSTKIVEHFK